MDRRLIPLAVAAAAVMSAAGLTQPPPALPPLPPNIPGEAAEGDPIATIPLPDLEARLTALTPDDPRAYFLLAEELAAEVEVAPAARPLAQSLFALSYELERAASGGDAGRADGAFGRSVCLALASIAPRDDERRWLLALARSLDAARADPEFDAPGPGPTRREAALDLATALGYVRSGEGRRAKTLLDKPGVAGLLAQYQGLLSGPGLSIGADTIRRYADQWPVCPECRNQRIVTRAGEGGGTKLICYTCRGNPGPRLSDEEVLLQLRLESALLSGIQRSWAAQVAIDAGAPLRDLDPAELGATYGVDASRPLWRDGQWQTLDGKAAEPEPAAPPNAPSVPMGASPAAPQS